MGVSGLWDLLSPVGYRVSNEHVHNKVLAIDVSIWLTQFIKAMRDAEGATLRNAHLLGVFRRCLKLLYLAVRPVLVFDGETPALKRRTLAQRSAVRERHAAKLRRIAEKLLVNQLKQTALASVVANTGLQKRLAAKSKPRRGRSPALPPSTASGAQSANAALPDETDEITPASPRAGENNNAGDENANEASAPDDPFSAFIDDNDDADELDDDAIALPANLDLIDEDALLDMPASMQAKLLKQIKMQHRSQHREHMLREKADPAAFSRAQISGFLRNTALNRRISNVREAINDHNGASRRIASDSARAYVLEEFDEDAPRPNVGTDQDADLVDSGSEDEARNARPSGSRGQENPQSGDILARIRRLNEGSRFGLQPRKKFRDGRAKLESSGVGWASQALGESRGFVLGQHELEHMIPKTDKDREEGSDGNDLDAYDVMAHAEPNIPATEDTAAASKDEDSDDDVEWEDGAEAQETDEPVVFPTVANNAAATGSASKDDARGEPAMIDLTEPAMLDLDEPVECNQQSAMIDLDEPTDTNDQPATLGLDDPADPTDPEKISASFDREGPSTLNNGPERLGVADASKREKVKENDSEDRAQGNESVVDTRPTTDSIRVNEESTERSTTTLPSKENEKSNNKAINVPQGNADVHVTEGSAKQAVQRKSTPAPKVVERASEVGDTMSSPTENLEIEPVQDDDEILPQSPREKVRRPHRKSTGGNSKDLDRQAVDEEDQDLQMAIALSMQEKQAKSATALEGDDNEEPLTSIPTSSDVERRNRQAPEETDEVTVRNAEGTTEKEKTPQNRAQKTSREGPRRTGGDDDEITPVVQDGAPPEAPGVSREEIEKMQRELQAEAKDIRRKKATHRSGIESVSDEMYAETRDLLKLFGIPYLQAPTEAEAQCAFLNMHNVVDGIITEDSDTFLFGAKTVYRQLFSNGKFAEAYDAKDISKSLGLSRDDLIRLAYLLGSDYTSGVRGVGVVNAMEILEAFPGTEGLVEFREWTKKVTVFDEEPDEDTMQATSLEAVRKQFCWKHRNMKRNWEIRAGFPNPAVTDAYLKPEVEQNKEKFKWGRVDFEGLRKFCWDKFGWEYERFEGTVGALRQKLREREGQQQRRIDEFFTPHRFAKIRSERLQKAVKGIVGDEAENLAALKPPKPPPKRKRNAVSYIPQNVPSDEEAEMVRALEEVERNLAAQKEANDAKEGSSTANDTAKPSTRATKRPRRNSGGRAKK